MTRRMDRVNVVLRQEISRFLAVELSDPRLSSMATVMDVDTSSDLRHAKVYVSVLGNQNEKENTLAALRSASGYIHRNMRKNLTLKSVPYLSFYLDESIERGSEMLELIKESSSNLQSSENP